MPAFTTFCDMPVDDCLVLACKGDSLPDSVSRVLLTLLLQNARPKELAPCAVYLYQTTRPHLRKYGISGNPRTRSVSAKGIVRNRYAELLCEHWCKSRLQAICFECALGEVILEMAYSEDDKAELSFCTELTNASAAEFNDYISLFEEDWLAKGPLGFISVNCQTESSRTLKLAEQLRNKQVEPALDTRMKNRFCYVSNEGINTKYISDRFKELSIPDAIAHLGLEGWNVA